MYTKHADIVGDIEQRFIDGWGLLQSGTIDAVAPNKFQSSDIGAFDGFEPGHWLESRDGLGANNGKLFTIAAVNTSVSPFSITVAESVTSASGDGDEQLFMWYTPAYFITTDEGGKWIVGELPQDKPYVELEMVGERESHLCYSPPSWKLEGLLDIRLHVPESAFVSFDFKDRCDAIFKDWTCGSLHFTVSNGVRRRVETTNERKDGYRTRICSYNWWAELVKG
jgi:hypothetical protein